MVLANALLTERQPAWRLLLIGHGLDSTVTTRKNNLTVAASNKLAATQLRTPF